MNNKQWEHKIIPVSFDELIVIVFYDWYTYFDIAIRRIFLWFI
jgi:hypothetical protein